MIYGIVKKLIENGAYDKDDLLNKLDVFFLVGSITKEQYTELRGLIMGESK